MTAESVSAHRANVDNLLSRLAPALAADTERLTIDTERMAREPWHYRERVLAAEARTAIDLPPFDNSQMDGYAVRSADLAGASDARPVRLRTVRPMLAGEHPRELHAGAAMPIMTGAAIPRGADAVVPVEEALPATFNPQPRTVRFRAPVATGTFVRRQGSDRRRGAVLIREGATLTAARLAALASAGIPSVQVWRRPRVLVVTTGAELAAPGATLGPGQIYDANVVSLVRLVASAGCDVRAVAVRSDKPRELLSALALGIGGNPTESADLVITAGAVSVGGAEVVREGLEPLGVRFAHVAMQPGGPQGLGLLDAHALGVGASGQHLPVICLPGNPVSVLVSFEMFVRPALRRLLGHMHELPEAIGARLSQGLRSPADKHQLRRGRLRPAHDGGFVVQLVGGPSSHLLATFGEADVLVHVPVGVDRLAAGSIVTVWRLPDA